MAKYLNLPDGTSLEVPDDVDYQTAMWLAQKQFPDAFKAPVPETTVRGNIKEAIKGIIPGAVGLLETAGTGISALLPEEAEKATRAKMAEIAAAAKTPFAAAPGYEDSIGRNIGEGLGSTLPFFAAGPLGVAGRIGAAGLGVAAGAGEARQGAEAKGATEEERAAATALGAPTGLLDILAPAIKPFKSMLATTLARGGVEGLTEAAQKVAQNLIAKGVYDPSQPIVAGAGEEGAYGAGVGALSSLIVDMVAPGKSRVAPKPAVTPPVTPPAPPAVDKMAVAQQYETALAQRDALQEQAKALAKSKDPADQLLYKQAQQAVKDHVRDVLNPLTEQYAPFKAEVTALRAKQAETTPPKEEAPKMPDGTPIPTNPLDVRRIYDNSVAELTAAKQRAKDAAKAGDMGLFAEADAAAEQNAQLVRTLQPFLPETPRPPKIPSLQEMQERQLQLIGGKTAKGKIKGILNSAIDVQDRPLIKQYSEELAQLQQKIAAAQKGEATLQQRQADLGAQTVAPEPVNPMADFQAGIDELRADRPRQLQEAGTAAEVAAMEAARMPTGRMDQMDLAGGPEKIYPKAPTIESLQTQLAQLPPAVQEQNAALLTQLQNNLPAVAADPDRAAQVSDWLYGLRTGRATLPVADEMAADVGRSAGIQDMLRTVEQGKMSETEQLVEPRYQALTEEQQAALKGTQGYRNRTVTPSVPLPTGEVATVVQKDMFPQEQVQGKLFPTMTAFQNFMGGDTLNKLRIKAGEGVQTLSRALRLAAPIERRIGLLEENAAREQEGYQRAIAAGDRGSEAAAAAHAAAQARMKALVQKLDVELQPLQIQWMEARNALKAAAENSFDVADTWYKNATKFGTVKGDAADAMGALVDAKGRLAEAVRQPVSKAAWDEMRAAQEALPAAESFFETHRAALPEEVNRFLAADRKANAALEQAIITEGRLREVHDSARAALDRLANNQQRRKSVQETKAAAEAEMRYQSMMRTAASRAAASTRALAAERAARANTAVRGAQAERAALLDPVLAAQAKRTVRITPEETQTEADARVNETRRAEQASQERLAALPGREIVAEQRRDWMNQLADAEAEVARGRGLLERTDLSESQRASGVTELNEAKRIASVLRAKLEQEEGQLTALQPKLEKKAAQVARLEGSEKGGVDEPGIEASTRSSRVKELNKARKALASMRQAAAKQSGITIKEKGEVAPTREEQSIEDALEEAQEKLEDAQNEGNARKVAFYKQQIKLLKSGTLPARKVGPLVKPVVNAGEMRTGAGEAAAKVRATGSRQKITQSGTPRSVTSKQAQREGNALSMEREANEGLDEETLRLKEEAAKDREAVAAAKAAPRLTEEEQIALQEELDAEMKREDRRAASAPDDNRTTTALSATGTEMAEDGRIMDLLDHIAETGATPERKAQAKALKGLLLRTKLVVQDNVMFKGKRVAGLYEPETNTVYLDREALSEEDFIHEAYHAATDSTLLAETSTLTPRQLQARKELTAMHEVLSKNPAFKDLHAATDVREFVAEVRTNDALRAQMQAVGKPATLWQRFTNALKRLLKLDNVAKADRLIEEILQPSRKIARAAATPSIMRKPVSELSADLTDFSKHVQDDRTTLDKAKELKDSAGLAFRQAVADVRASLREALAYGNTAQGSSISALVTQRDSIINNMQAVADFGAFGTAKDARGNLIVSAGHSASLRDVIEAARELPGADADERLKLFHDYRVAKRAEQVGWSKFDFKNATQAAADGRKLLAAVDADSKLKAALAAVDKPYNDLNQGLIKFVADAHALPKEATDAMLADKNYVPFYRVNGDTISLVMPDGHPVSIGDIRTQPYLQTLVGGDQALMGFTDSVMRNISTLTSLALDNMTAKQVAYHLQDVARGTDKMKIQRGKGPASQDIVRFRQTPDPKTPQDDGWRHITVDTEGTAIEGIPTPLLVQSIAGTYSTLPGFTKVGAVASDLLRSGVTRNPFYIVRQLLKDSTHASLTGNVEATPFMATAKSLRNFIAIMRDQSPEAATLRKHGVLHSNIFSGTTSDYNKVARMLAGDQQGWINRTIAFMDKAAMAADAATRTQAYQDIIAKGGTEMEAANAARELMNFNRHGSASSIQFFSRVIPFFNAAIQGLDVLYRSATGKMPAAERMNTKQKFFNRAMGMSAMAMAYAVMMEDDPEWNSLTLQQKMANIMIPNGFSEDGEALKLPIPFETGMAFFSMPVALVEALRKDFTATDWKAVRSVLLAQMPGGGSLMPQIAKGAFDVSRNYNSFLGAPIESAKMARLDPTQRFTSKTTEVAKAFSEAVTAVGVPLSPIQLEYLSNAYFGQLPLMVAESVNSLFEDADKVAPAKHLSESKVWGWLFQGEIGTDASAHAYEAATAAEMARNTFQKMVESGDREGAKRYREEHKAEFAAAQAAGAFTKRMGLLNTEMERIRNAPKASQLTPEEKQKRIDNLKKVQQEMSNQFLERYQRMVQNVEQGGALQ